MYRPIDKDVRSTTLERLRKTREADLYVSGLPQPLQLGEGLYHLLDHIHLPVEPDDLILGRILEEVPDEEGEAYFQTVIEEWDNRAIPPWMRDGGHECLAWERLLELGLPGLEECARRELERREAAGEPQEVLDFLRGAVRVYQAFRRYARRYAGRAWEEGLLDPAQNCSAVAERPPETFAEGLQLIWLVGHVYCTMLAMNPTLTFGRMDWLLIDLYRRDLAAGRLTREEAGRLIADFFYKNEIILGRGEHQMSGGSEKDTGWQRNLTYDAPQYVVLGGRRPEGSAEFEELTELFLERVDPRFENPVIVLRYHRDMPDGLWRRACAKMRANASFMVYSDENIIPAMVHCGIDPADAVGYTMHGCNWPDIPGIQHQVGYHQAVLPQYFLDALFGFEEEIPSIDALYERFAENFRREIEEHCQQLRQAPERWEGEAPGLLRVDACFSDGPIQNARSWDKGGVRYPTLTCAITSIATATDCFAAVDELVLRSGEVDLETLKRALRDDFAGHEPLRQRMLRAPKFGQDDVRGDGHAVRVLDTVLEEIDRAARLGNDDQVIVFRCLETDMRHLWIGAKIGATTDGRCAGEPISENTSPYPGSCKNGLTAMLRSLAKLRFERINSGALNVRLQPKLVDGEEGLNTLAALLRTYFDMGGLQVQLSVVDVDTLREAQRCPERHRDLMVRITGYSAVFVDMARHAQDEIIRREEMGSV